MSDNHRRAAGPGPATVRSVIRKQHTTNQTAFRSIVESHRQLRVVIVEDSPIIRARLAETLGEIPDVDLIDAVDTEDAALSVLREPTWDAVVLDLQLKVGTGLGVLRTLGTRRPPGAKVIVFTNYAAPLYRERSMKLGADYFFDKAREFHRVREVLADLAAAGTSASR
jgi:two-component system OmpR family response regulator